MQYHGTFDRGTCIAALLDGVPVLIDVFIIQFQLAFKAFDIGQKLVIHPKSAISAADDFIGYTFIHLCHLLIP